MTSKSFVIEFLSNPKLRIYRHLILVVIIFFLSILNVFEFHKGLGIFYASLATLFAFAFPVYTNLYILVPKYFIRNKIATYVSLLLLIISLSLVIMSVALQYIWQFYGLEISCVSEDRDPYSILKIIGAVVSITLFVAGTTSLYLFRRWMTYDLQIHELENATMQTELKQLKNQINPHFLFNMLNNANILVKENPDEASLVLSRLNDLLQYQLNDSSRSEVYLSADITFLSSFLELEKVRRDNFQFIISKEGQINNTSIPPLLFIPFVENAIKHNPDSENLSYVHLYFEVRDKELFFTCINSKPRVPIKSEGGGLGLSNIKRRLELLFPNKHTLELIDTETIYTVKLHLQL